MMNCEQLRNCAFYANYAQQESFRRDHFNYFCLGPLADSCARRQFLRLHGSMPRADFSPLGVPFGATGTDA